MADFTHTPRAPHCPQSHPDQRYFGGADGDGGYDDRWLSGNVRVYRNASWDTADLDIRSDAGKARVEASISLTPAEMRELAHRLLDAAHDAESNPAAALSEQVAMAEKDRECVAALPA